MEMLQGVWKQHLRPRAVVGYCVKIFLHSSPNYVTRSPGTQQTNAYMPSLRYIRHATMPYSLLSPSPLFFFCSRLNFRAAETSKFPRNPTETREYSPMCWTRPRSYSVGIKAEATDTDVKAQEKSAVKLFSTGQLCSLGRR